MPNDILIALLIPAVLTTIVCLMLLIQLLVPSKAEKIFGFAKFSLAVYIGGVLIEESYKHGVNHVAPYFLSLIICTLFCLYAGLIK